MPWTETAPMKERMRFVTDWERGLYSMVELCERYGVSRKTGYKWIGRYEGDGPDGLRDRSRAPHHCPHRMAVQALQLNVWWIRLGIQRQRICRPIPSRTAPTNGCIARSRRRRPGRPAHLAAQQRAFNRFRRLYNDERPHQFLDGRTPASLYRPSPRRYTGTLPPIWYPGHYIPKRVTNAGRIRFKKRLLFMANSLKQQVLRLEEVEDGVWSIYSAVFSWPASMNTTTFSARENAAAAFRGYPRYGPGDHRRSARQRAIRHPGRVAP